MAELSASYTVIIQRCTDVSHREALISQFHYLMFLAWTYTWSAVCAYHDKVLRSIEMGFASWGILLTRSSSLFSYQPLSSSTQSTKHKGCPSPRQPSSSTSGHFIPRSEICDAWSWYDDYKSHKCPLRHIYIVRKRDHQAKTCPKNVSGSTTLPRPHFTRLTTCLINSDISSSSHFLSLWTNATSPRHSFTISASPKPPSLAWFDCLSAFQRLCRLLGARSPHQVRSYPASDLCIPNSSTLQDRTPLPFFCQYPLVSKCTNEKLSYKTTTTPTSVTS